MTTVRQGGGAAFPANPNNSHCEPGMSLRDWFAGQALAGVASRQNFHAVARAAAKEAYALADAMLAERSKP